MGEAFSDDWNSNDVILLCCNIKNKKKNSHTALSAWIFSLILRVSDGSITISCEATKIKCKQNSSLSI